MTDSEGALKWLRVHVRRSVEPAGVTSLTRTVFCPNRGARVSLDACSGCGNRFAIDHRDRDVFLVCDVPEQANVPPAEQEPQPSAIHRSGDCVADVMTTDVVCVSPDLSVRDLLNTFLERSISGAPVLEGGKPVGIVSKTDVVRVLHGSAAAKIVATIDSSGSTYQVATRDVPSLEDVTVRDVMTQLALALPDVTPVERAAAIMAYEGIHRLPVVSSSEEVVGLVTTIDILRWLARKAGYVVPGRTAQQC